jgi:hypothetical protein
MFNALQIPGDPWASVDSVWKSARPEWGLADTTRGEG